MLFGVASAPVAAQNPARPALRPVAILTLLSGGVLVRTAAGEFTSAVDGAVLYVGTVLRTSADARALITLFEGSTMELDPASDVTIEDARGGSTLAQAFGRGLWVVMRLTTADSRYEQTTPAATASVRGVDFEVEVAAGFGAFPTTLMPAARLTPAVATPSVGVVPVLVTTERANTTLVSTSSTSRRDRARKILAPVAPRVLPLERSRAAYDRGDDSGAEDDDRDGN